MATKYLVFTALMTAIISVLGLFPPIHSPIISGPIVLQNIGVFLAALLLGRIYGTLSVILFMFLVATGVPLLSGGRGGIEVIFGVSTGFLLMYPIVAYLIGLIRDIYIDRINFKLLFIATTIIGVTLLDVVGAVIMGVITSIPMSKSILLSFIFIPGDIIKAIIASIIGNILLNFSEFRQIIK